ncbi:von Willebrand factor D and EGF domain-containing protein-like [Glandiceps talaboti]
MAANNTVAGQEPDPCFNYVEIDEVIRSTAHKTDRSLGYSYLLCDDNLLYQWYRFVSAAGGRLATDENIPDEYTCGTHVPIYMIGNHPESDVIEERTVREDFSGLSWTIDVKKCDGFYVYKLISVDNCAMAYCAGSEERCPTGENSPTGFTPGCTSIYPKILKGPIIINEILLNKERNLNFPAFHCSFESELDEHRTELYEIDWYVDGILVLTDSLTKTDNVDGEFRSTLSEFQFPSLNPCTYEEGMYHLGQTLRCAVTSRFESGNVTSPMKYSDYYYAGIRANDSVVYLEENGDPQSIYLYTTVYVKCDPGGSDTCDVSAWLKSNPKDKLGDHCRVDFHSNEDMGILKEFRIAYRYDQEHSEKNPQETYILEFDEFIKFNPFYFSCHRPTYVTVQRRDKPSASCIAWGDPHYTTFNKRVYDWYGTGDYVMVKPREGVNNHNFTVHARLRKCNSASSWNPSCNCAIAVREGNEVAIVDLCGGPQKPPLIKVYRDPQNCNTAFQVTISQDGSELRINTPSGQRVRATLYTSYYTNVYIDVNGGMSDKIEGLCGLFNDSPLDDFDYFDKDSESWKRDNCGGYTQCLPIEFPNSYRLAQGTSLFYPDNRPTPGEAESDDYPRCECKKDEDEGIIAICTGSGKPMGGYSGGKEVTTCEDVFRKRRAVDEGYNDDDEYDPYQYEFDDNDNEFDARNLTWPTPSGISEEEAIQRCNNALNQSNIIGTCVDLDAVNDLINSSVDDCVFDILVMDDFTSVDIIRTTIEGACLFEFYSNVSLWEPNDDGELAPPTSVVNAVCPNHCSSHGQCGMDGNCTCDEGYTAVDCSIEIGVPPVVNKILSGDLCDVKTRPCERVSIQASGLLNSEDLTCIVKDFKYLSDSLSWEETGKIWKTSADFFTAYQAYCYLPLTEIHKRSLPDSLTTVMYKAFGISLSNDGEVESNQVFLKIFDSLCVNCTSTGDCFQKENTCLIDSKCYTANEINPADECISCLPDVSINSWSPLTSGACEHINQTQTETVIDFEDVEKNQWYIPVIAVFTSVFGALLIAAVMYCFWKQWIL